MLVLSIDASVVSFLETYASPSVSSPGAALSISLSAPYSFRPLITVSSEGESPNETEQYNSSVSLSASASAYIPGQNMLITHTAAIKAIILFVYTVSPYFM